jgi:hypothetical protein
MSQGLPFIGEDGYYPPWAKGRGQWVFQRTLVALGGLMAGAAELAAQQVPSAGQVIVWVPQRRGLLRRIDFSAMQAERQIALHELWTMDFLCYGDGCDLEIRRPSGIAQLIEERGIAPEHWHLSCPECGAVAGPNLTPVTADGILKQWHKAGRPKLESPSASRLFKAATPISDLAKWVEAGDPSHLELAYVGQQMWSNISAMLDDLKKAP